MRTKVCLTCGKVYPNRSFALPDICEVCGGRLDITCEKIGCTRPACSKGIYGPGYIVSVCQEHYDAADQEDKDNAIKYRYAE